MKELNLICCARAFEEVGFEGADLLGLSREDVVPILTETGA